MHQLSREPPSAQRAAATRYEEAQVPQQHEVRLAHQFAARTTTPIGSVAALLIGTILLSLIAPGPASALQIRELKSPQSFVAAPDSQAYFISNVNGEPAAKDNNGFITKLDHDGKVVDLHFIQGGRRDAVLHAPKGMAIVGTTLYVADVDALRAFDTKTGQPGVTIEMPASARRPVTHGLADVVHDDNGILYVSDADSNTVYRVDTAREDGVSVLASDAVLAGPRGIAVHPQNRPRDCRELGRRHDSRHRRRRNGDRGVLQLVLLLPLQEPRWCGF